MTVQSSPAEAAGRPTYSRQQLEQYFDLICLPAERRRFSLSTETNGGSTNGLSDKADDLAYLSLLMKHQVVRVPFENLTQHYSWHKIVDPRPSHLYKKIVGAASPAVPRPPTQNGDRDNSAVPIGGGRGGYCMEVNSFFHTVLLSLGFDVYLAGARVWSPTEKRYSGFSHCVNIVTISGVRYLVDVAFGGNVAIAPLPLPDFEFAEEGAGPTHEHIPPARMRVVRAPISQGLSRARGHNLGWVYQIKYDYEAEKDDEDKWITQYMFVDTEFLLEDIVVCNMFPAFNKNTFFTHKVLCVRFTTDLEVGPGRDGDEGRFPGRASTKAVQEGKIDGNLMLWGDLFKWRRNGETVLERKIESDVDRLDILKKYFGIELDEEDVRGIVGTAGALGGQ
ncbi:uncharacterized protein B0I36DRAFT_324714 [Microdochium trichocladiopsis]|uniref:Arylamine N-acetyltransferase n=1 Tax=Microdochium trichocladiopsis TaxID=1682393 RepID=A0A9P8Y669_9PEZI|nr:uncharacterized protein B0I36DRAFT_324714 [Microdochium trichocladiopsis]KAH7028881.1 hypothetical protein B0I36DRAFT_324714 [Microdochium trichocladiopsis]